MFKLGYVLSIVTCC